MKWLSARNPWARRYGSWLVLGPLLLGLTSPAWWWWGLRPARSAAVIVDKTSAPGNPREHASLLWVLRHQKVRCEVVSTLDRASLARSSWVFLADTYGPEQGGMSGSEIEALEGFCKAGGWLYAEFNTLAWPTRGAVRKRLERLLGLRFTGWTARHFSDLSQPEEPSAPLKRALQGQSGPGWVWLHEDGRVVVLREGSDVPPRALELKLPHGPALGYSYWLDVVEPREPAARAVAHFQLNCLPAGRAKLRQHGLPRVFPALVLGSRSVYACGDFSDNRLALGPYWLEGWPTLQQWRARGSQDAQRLFFWSFYVPLIELWLGRSSPVDAG